MSYPYKARKLAGDALEAYGYERTIEQRIILDNTTWTHIVHDLTLMLQRHVSPTYAEIDARELLHQRGYYASYEKPDSITSPPKKEKPEKPTPEENLGAKLKQWLPLALVGAVAFVVLLKE